MAILPKLAGGMFAAAMAVGLLARPVPLHAAPESITVALPGDAPSLDPTRDGSPPGAHFRLNVFDALTELQRDGDMTPRLAESWTYSDDLTEWTFKLRENVRFHDGSPFTADDVVFTVERIKNDQASTVRTFLRLVDSVEKVDDYHVKFKLNAPYAIFHRQISYVNIISKTYFDKVGDEGVRTKPVGTGPYKFVAWVKDDRMELEANPDYWRGEPAIKKAVFRPVPSEASRAAALISGEVDLVPSIPPSLRTQLESASGVEVGVAPSFRVIFMAFNPNNPPLDNDKVREAIDLSIDREAIATQLLRGMAKPTGVMVPPMNIGYNDTIKPTVYDPEKAKQLLAEAGYEGEPITIKYPNNNIAMGNEMVQAIAGYMTAAGLNVQIVPMEFTAFFPEWLQSKIESAYFFAFGSTQYHAESILTALYEAGSRAYKVNPEIDRLVKEQRMVTDVEKQKELLGEAFKFSNQDRYHLPLFDEMQVFGKKEGLDYEPWADGFVRLYDFK